MNGDGKLDLVVGSLPSGTVSVLLGNGTGTFQNQQTIAKNSDPQTLVLGDVNGDGVPDLALTNENANNLSVLLGNGNGTFQAQQTMATGSGLYALALADVNGDGRPDLIAANYNDKTVSVFLNNGNGNFTGQVYTVDTVAPFVQSINRAFPAGSVAGAGTVTFTVTFSEAVTSVNPADFELAKAGTVGAKLTQVTPVSAAVYTLAVSGVTGNGSLGLNLVDNGSIHDLAGHQLTQASGTGNGNFTGQTFTIDTIAPFVQSIDRATGSNAVANSTTVAFTVTFSEPVTGVDASDFQVAVTGSVATAATQITAVSGAVYTVSVSGITGSGTLGLNLVDNATIRDLAGNPLTQQNAPAAFQTQQTIHAGNVIDAVAVGDVNGDGISDLVMVYGLFPGTVSVLLGNGNGHDISNTAHLRNGWRSNVGGFGRCEWRR